MCDGKFGGAWQHFCVEKPGGIYILINNITFSYKIKIPSEVR